MGRPAQALSLLLSIVLSQVRPFRITLRSQELLKVARIFDTDQVVNKSQAARSQRSAYGKVWPGFPVGERFSIVTQIFNRIHLHPLPGVEQSHFGSSEPPGK